MAFAETFYNETEDCEWLREAFTNDVRSALLVPFFQSFILLGNEDCPQRIKLFSQSMPHYQDSPIAVYVLDGESHPFVWRDEMITD